MKKEFVTNIFLGSIIIIIYNLLGWLFWYNHTLLLFPTLTITFIVSYIVFKKTANSKYLKNGLVLILPYVIIFFSACLYYKDFSRGLPYIVFVPLSTYFSFLYFKYRKIYMVILSLILFAFVSFFLFPNYFIYYNNHDAEKNIVFKDISLVNYENKKVELDKNKIIVLDFWSTSCGICFKKFPDLELTHKKFIGNKKVQILSINVPIKGDDFNKTIKILDSLGYSFPKLYAKSLNQVEEKLKFNTFPHLMIIKNGMIRYDGFLVTKEESNLYNIDDEINKLINED